MEGDSQGTWLNDGEGEERCRGLVCGGGGAQHCKLGRREGRRGMRGLEEPA